MSGRATSRLLLSASLSLLLSSGCKQGEGARCETMDDCTGNLTCVVREGEGVCTDTSRPRDGGFDAPPVVPTTPVDASVDGPPNAPSREDAAAVAPDARAPGVDAPVVVPVVDAAVDATAG